MTRIGVLSDTHIHNASQNLPPKILKAFESVEIILHAGDWVDLCVLDWLRPLARVVGVRGNMDKESVTSYMPDIQELEIEGFKIGLTHGWGPPDGIEKRVLRKFTRPLDLVVFGHTHRALFQRQGNLFYFNPGSPTDRVFASERTFGLITLGKDIKAEILPAE